MYDSLILNSQPIALQLMSGQSLSNIYFSGKAHHSLPVLRNTKQYFHTALETISNSKITNKSYKNEKKQALNRPQERYLFIVWEQKQEREHCLV